MNHGILYYIWGQFTARGRIYIYGALVLLIVILIIGNQISSCRSTNFQKKVDNAANSEAEGKGEVKVLEEDKNTAVNDAVNKETIANEKANNLDNISNRDSNTFNSNWSSAKQRFCKQFVTDSICRR